MRSFDSKFTLIRRLSCSQDGKGVTTEIESGTNIPFDVRRVYYMYDTQQGIQRGGHAHRKLEQLLVCVCGSVKIVMDDGSKKETLLLDDPAVGLYMPPEVWHEMTDFSGGAVLLVFASDLYDESDYIRSYNEFLKYKEETGH